MIKSKKLWLGLALASLLAPGLFGQSLGDAREVIKELIESNAKLENRVIEQEAQLTARGEQLTKLSKLLETIKIENETLQNENELMTNLLSIAEALEKERKSYLTKVETERTVFLIAAGVLGLGWGVDRLFGR